MKKVPEDSDLFHTEASERYYLVQMQPLKSGDLFLIYQVIIHYGCKKWSRSLCLLILKNKLVCHTCDKPGTFNDFLTNEAQQTTFLCISLYNLYMEHTG